MLQKILFNMLVKTNRSQCKEHTETIQECKISHGPKKVDGIRGLNSGNNEKYPGTRKRNRNMYILHIMFIFKRLEALYNEINNLHLFSLSLFVT